MRDTLTLARDHGIPTRLVLMPEATWFRELYSAKARARFDHWIRELADEAGCPRRTDELMAADPAREQLVVQVGYEAARLFAYADAG